MELLIETGYWLERAEFVERAIIGSGEGARIDWNVAGDLAGTLMCSRGERFLLQLACSLADPSHTVAMSEIGSIDGRNLARVREALETAKFGWR